MMRNKAQQQSLQEPPAPSKHRRRSAKNNRYSFTQLHSSLGNRSVQRLVKENFSNPFDFMQWRRGSKHKKLKSDTNRNTPIQRFDLDDALDFAGDVVGVGSQIAGPANLLDKVGYWGQGTAGLLGGAGSVLGKAAPALALVSGVRSLLNEEAGMEETALGTVKTIGGGAGTLGNIASLLAGEAAIGGSSLFGMSAGTALTGGGAGLSAAGAGAALTSAGAVALSGAAGYGVGRLLDEGFGGLMNLTGLSGVLDRSQGIDRPEGQSGDYSLSGLSAISMTGLDRTVTKGMRSLDFYDDTRPEYTQTIGWRLAEILPSWMQ